MDLIQFDDTYRGHRVLVTGHTGFKGSWLTCWLDQLGAQVAGISLDMVSQPNHWALLGLGINSQLFNIRNTEKVLEFVDVFKPEIVFHLAAQPLVRRSYQNPIENWSTNVMGTANVLDACRKVNSVRAVVAVTTDKVYKNQEWSWAYREDDRLGGHDPYSASKAACEILIESYRNAFFQQENAPLLASARAGNVIGGGDWSEDRLIPDLVRSVDKSTPMVVRSPHATRPWQHVLECLTGYLQLGQKLTQGRQEFATAWNFGPATEDNCSVSALLQQLQLYWPELKWSQTQDSQPHEAKLLHLDHSKAKSELGWKPVWNLERALKETSDWYRQFQESARILTMDQLYGYIGDAYSSGASWVQK